MGRLYGKLGKGEDEKKAYDRVLKDYSDQKEAVSVARTRLGGDVRSASKPIVLSKIWTGNTPGADHTVMAFTGWPLPGDGV